MATAVAALKRKEIDRIFLVRPVVEAGESLGFLPGDFQAKLDPYMRPILDELYEMRGRMVELEERVDFTERLLASRRADDPAQLPPS